MLRRLLLVAAFLFCAVGIYGLLAGHDKSAPQPQMVVDVVEDNERVEVWKPRQPIAKGSQVALEDLVASLSSAESDQDLPTLKLAPGAIAKVDIAPETSVTKQMLVMPDDPEYIDYLITPGMIPYSLTLPSGSNYQSILTPGDRVDVVMIAALEQNLASGTQLTDFRGLSIGRLLSGLRVIALSKAGFFKGSSEGGSVVLELNHEQLAKLLLARRVGVLDIHKSTGAEQPVVRTGDVLNGYSSVTELRGNRRLVN